MYSIYLCESYMYIFPESTSCDKIVGKSLMKYVVETFQELCPIKSYSPKRIVATVYTIYRL